MSYILQVDFPMDGPFGAEMTAVFRDLAQTINDEAGMQWKIWTENAETKEAGGIYLFTSEEEAQAYLTMHSQRLAQAGIKNIRSRIFAVNKELTKINQGPVVD